MKKLLFFASLLMTMMQVSAADVSLTAAQATATRFLCGRAAGKSFSGAPAAGLKLLYTEVNSTQADKAVYYIFNSDQGFVIVAGDDRAHQILAHGDRPLDLKRMPVNMKFWLGTYKKQLEYLQARPGMVVELPTYKNLRAGKVEPMLTAEWDQGSPYNNHCPEYEGELCLTGCPATSLSMVFYYWKYPTDPTPEVEGYTTLGSGINVPALPSITFDWDNMLDKYTYTATVAQKDAVAWLMRYIGQEEQMNYTPTASGAMTTDILRAVEFFGYDEEMARVGSKSVLDENGNETQYLTDEEWIVMLRNELDEGRPVVYCAYDHHSGYGYNYWSGHAFNVDGYDSSDNTYHVNWGWSGEGNGDFVLNAFTADGFTFNVGQEMIMGIQPPFQGPTIRVAPFKLDMNGIVGQTATATITVRGHELNNAVALALDDPSGVFSMDANSIAVSELDGGKTITVTYAPQASGTHTATITLSSPGAEDKIVTINATAVLETYKPVMLPAAEQYVNLTQFRADWTDQTPADNIESYTLEVSTRPFVELLDSIDGRSFTGDYEDTILTAPWSGKNVVIGNGAVFFYYGGYISYIVPDGYSNDVFTLQITTSTDDYGSGNLTVGSTQTPAVGHEFNSGQTFAWLVTASEGEKITITSDDSDYSPDMSTIRVYAGDVNNLNSLRGAAEVGDNTYRLISGITDNYYTVKDLAEAGTFYFRVKATYSDGTQSRWSNMRRVTLFENGHSFELGDVNHDGTVAIDDATALMDFLLDSGEVCGICADINGDNIVDIADVTDLIDLLLGGN